MELLIINPETDIENHICVAFLRRRVLYGGNIARSLATELPGVINYSGVSQICLLFEFHLTYFPSGVIHIVHIFHKTRLCLPLRVLPILGWEKESSRGGWSLKVDLTYQILTVVFNLQ